MLYTSADLLEGVKSKAAMPDSQVTFSDERILKLADEKIKSKIVPAVLSTREDYYLTYVDYTVSSSSYAIPSSAIGMKIARVAFVDEGGVEWPCIRVHSLLETYESSDYFYIMKNTLYFDSLPTRTVRVYYHSRPLSLVLTTAAMQITGISGQDLSVSAVPAAILATDSVVGVAANPGYETIMSSNVISGIVSTTLTMTSAIPSTLAVGDWLSEGLTSPVPQIPLEMQTALEWLTASAILKSQGDAQGSQMCDQEGMQALKDAILILQPRVDSAAQKIVKRDSALRESADGIFNSGVWIR